MRYFCYFVGLKHYAEMVYHLRMPNPYSTDKDRDPPWWYVFIASILLGASVFAHHYFTVFESEGGKRSGRWK